MRQSNGNSVQSVDRIGIWAVKTVLIDFRLKQRVSWEWDQCYLYYDWSRSIFFFFWLHFAHALILCRGEVKGDRELNFSEIPFKINIL